MVRVMIEILFISQSFVLKHNEPLMSPPEKYSVLNSKEPRWRWHCKGGSWWYKFSNISRKGLLILRFISINSAVEKMPTKSKRYNNQLRPLTELRIVTDRMQSHSGNTHKGPDYFTLFQWLIRKQTKWQLNSWCPGRKRNVNGNLLNTRRAIKKLYIYPKWTEIIETQIAG